MKKILGLIICSVLLGGGVASAEELEWFEDEGFGEDEITEDVEANGRVFLEAEALNHDILRVEAKVTGLQIPVLGLAFHLEYDEEVLSFLRYDPGEFLERGGDPFYLVMNRDEGRLIFGETLRRNDSFPIGEGVVAIFYFQELDKNARKDGRDGYVFHFANGVVSTLDTVRQDIDHVEFVDLEVGSTDEESFGFGADVSGSVGRAFGGGGLLWIVITIVGCLTLGVFYLLKKKASDKICDF
jgi:hypothetical protein